MTPWETYGDALVRAYAAPLDPSAPVPDVDAAAATLLTGPSMLTSVAALAGLTVAEAQVLALLAAVEVSPALQRLLTLVQDDLTRPRATLATVAGLFPDPHPGALALSENGRLRRAALVDVDRTGPWGAWQVSAASALVWALCGDRGLDPDLPPGVRVRAGTRVEPCTGRLLLVCGADLESRRRAAVDELGALGVLVTPPPRTRLEWDAVVREATVGGLAVLVEVDEVAPAGLEAALQRADHLAWALGSPQELPLAELPDVARREVVLTDGTAGEEEWLAMTGGACPPGARLDRRQLQLVALGAEAPAQAVRRLAGGHLERLATRRRPRRGWDDLVLPAALREQVRGLVARHRQRALVYGAWGFPGLPSRGTVALLAGPSGTGKTLTAEVVAGELGLDLFVLDLSSVMSKYIGETEKNLAALFDAAAAGEVVLFFDEADALFGKRSAVSDAKDRYANVEVAYLLQRLEQHDGMVLLATNLPNNIDEAFLRRLHATLEYTAPGVVERRAIWERAFPPGCPTEDLDLDRLAEQVDLTGGPIAAAALASAFTAAAAGEPVTMPRVLAAVAAEYRKQGRLSVPAAVGTR